MTALLRTLAVALFLAVPRAALACPVCFGNSDAPMAKATNLGVIAMLVIVVGVLAGFATFIVHLARRARLVNEAAASGSNPQEGTA